MKKLSRRSVLRGSLGMAAAGTIARPYIANAAATTASVWWNQGFVSEEDASFRAVVAEYEKASGNKIDQSIIPFAPLMQKIVSALKQQLLALKKEVKDDDQFADHQPENSSYVQPPPPKKH